MGNSNILTLVLLHTRASCALSSLSLPEAQRGRRGAAEGLEGSRCSPGHLTPAPQEREAERRSWGGWREKGREPAAANQGLQGDRLKAGRSGGPCLPVTGCLATGGV